MATYFPTVNGRIKVQFETIAGGANPPAGWIYVPTGEGNNPGAQGSGYYFWRSETELGSDSIPNKGVVKLQIFIETAGIYSFRLQGARDSDDPGDARNDIWLKIDDDANDFTLPGTPDLIDRDGFVKFYRAKTTWDYAFKLGVDNPDLTTPNPDADFHLSAGFHTITLAGRSNGMHVDWLTIFEQGLSPAKSAPDTAPVVETILGTPGDDIITGTATADVIDALAGKDELLGGGGNDTLIGGSGIDHFKGGIGNDQMVGGRDNDTYQVADVGDVVVEQAEEGHDTVVASVSWTIGPNVEDLTLIGSAQQGIGNNLFNVIKGNAGANELSGGVGNDRLYGRGGNDLIHAGAGRDLLNGGTGKDVLIGAADGDNFQYLTAAEAGTASARDIILDFSVGQGDIIDLRGIDANSQVAGAQAFDFKGSVAFSGTAGELIYRYSAVFGDLNGDRVADLSIYIDNGAGLTEAQFLL